MRRNALFWGFILIAAGGLLLLDNLGIINVNIWGIIWPLLLIAFGLSILWGIVFRASPEIEQVNIPLDGASRARVRVRHGAGRLRINSGTRPGELIEGSFGGGVEVSQRRTGDLLEVNMSMPSRIFAFPFFSWPGSNLNWSLALASDTPLSLDLDMGANDARLDLSDINVSELRLKSGANSTNVILPANAGFTRADFETGVASVRIKIPSGVAARIRARGGLSSINVDRARFPRMGDVYQSADYDTATNKVEIDVETGVGSVEIS